ncbi:MAG: peptidoglycan synthetase [Fimbriimonadaceae bacterium]|nr:peptidoglycan synthetase [Chitinophagales bacterium]
MRIHLVALGGAVMHNLAIALKNKGYTITGSDDEIFEPSLSRLQQHGLLPEQPGWFTEKITSSLNAVILGMHARADNPELLEAQRLNISVYNFPEYVYEQSKNKNRIAVCGSHGKTTITSMIMHCLKKADRDFDYLVGAQLEGFETMVQLSDANTIIIEGDEYFASALDKRPKFLFYQPHITLISGIEWDHFNVFPTWQDYKNQFIQLINSLHKDSFLIYNAEDKNIDEVLTASTCKAQLLSYATPNYIITNENTSIQTVEKKYTFNIFGKHNLQNMMGAKNICNLIGINDETFYSAMQTFKGASKRLEIFYKNDKKIIFRDFAHAPSKVKATIDAVKEQYLDKRLIACLELYTFSSLNKSFIPQYKNTMQNADVRIVYFNPHTLTLKKLPALTIEEVKKYFNDDELIVLHDSNEIISIIKKLNFDNTAVLLMSSGNFDNVDFNVLT